MFFLYRKLVRACDHVSLNIIKYLFMVLYM